MNIPNKAVEAAKSAGDSFGLELTSSDLEQLLEAAAPFIAAQALRDAAAQFDERSGKFYKTMQNMADIGRPDYTADDITRCGAYGAESDTAATMLRRKASEIEAGN